MKPRDLADRQVPGHFSCAIGGAPYLAGRFATPRGLRLGRCGGRGCRRHRRRGGRLALILSVRLRSGRLVRLPVPLLEHRPRATEARDVSLPLASAGSVSGTLRSLRRTVGCAIATSAEAPTVTKASGAAKYALGPEE